MADKELRLVFKAVDKATPVIKKLTGETGGDGIKGISDALEGLIVPAAAVFTGVTALGGALVATFGKYQEYVSDVADLNAVLSGTYEETSMLVRMTEDYGVSQSAMLSAMRTLAKEGYEPNIESLIVVRDKLAAVTSGSERLVMAQELLGNQGSKELLPMFAEMGAELDNYVRNFDDGLIVTEEMADRQADLAEQMAILSLEGDKFALSFGEHVTPALIDFMTWANDPTWVKTITTGIDVTTRSMAGLEDWVGKTAAGVGDMGEEVETLTEKEYYLLAAEALLAGNTRLAQHFVDAAVAAAAEKAEILGVIAALQELDGKSVSYNIVGFHQGMGGPSGLDQGTGPMGTLTPGPGGIPEGGFATWAAGVDAGYQFVDGQWVPKLQTGGSFTVGGSGGPDSQRVSFMGTPGETVTVGGGTSDMETMLAEVRRLVNTLPTAIRDAVAEI